MLYLRQLMGFPPFYSRSRVRHKERRSTDEDNRSYYFSVLSVTFLSVSSDSHRNWVQKCYPMRSSD